MRYLIMLGTTLALLVLITAVPLLANAAPQPVVRIKIGDLPLSQPRSWSKLHRRVARAAHSVCDTANEALDPSVRRAQRACRQQLTDDALAAVAARQQVRSVSR